MSYEKLIASSLMVLTRGELRRREEAVVAGFVERNGDKAYFRGIIL